jgi:hypothetical protein
VLAVLVAGSTCADEVDFEAASLRLGVRDLGCRELSNQCVSARSGSMIAAKTMARAGAAFGRATVTTISSATRAEGARMATMNTSSMAIPFSIFVT